MDRDGLHGYVFSWDDNPLLNGNTRQSVVAVAWSSERARPLLIDPAARGFDLMGNAIANRSIELTETPIYLTAQTPEPVFRSLGER